MTPELIPMIDLRLLSQSDLTALSLSSPAAFDLRRRCDDDVVVPKIDRSVFNESAGSRKQTYSRLRLAPRKPNSSSSSSSSLPPRPSPAPSDDPARRENDRIVALLRHLFARDDRSSSSSSNPVPIQSQSPVLALAAPPIPRITAPPPPPIPRVSAPEPSRPPVAASVSARAPEEVSRALVLVDDDRDKEVLNAKGAAVDVVGLGMKEDPFAAELRRRTEGLKTEEELLGFLSGMDGQWGSRRKKRKIVDAAVFGDDLPRGWKLLIGLKRKEGVPWLHCRRYVSPSGKQFVSCKEVASYMYTLFGHQDGKQQISGQDGKDSPALAKLTPRCAAGPASQANITKDDPGYFMVNPITSISADQENSSALFRVPKQTIEPKKVLECHKCNLTFGDKEALVQHLLSFHQRSVKRRRLGKSIGDGVIIKDGKYECQFCHKIFTERHRYNGHVGAHVRYQGLSGEGYSDEINMRKVMNPTPLAAVPFSGMDVLTNKKEETCTAKSVDIHVGSSTCRLEMENHEIIQHAKYDAPETSQIACTSKSVDERISSYVTNGDITEMIVENCGTISTKSNVCADVVSPSTIDTNSAPQDCSHDISQEDSLSKPAGDQINSIDMNGYKFEETFENSNVQVMKPNECLNTISPLLPNVGNTPRETVNTTSMSKSVDSQIIDFGMNGFNSEVIVEDSSVRDIKPNECLNATSASLTITDNVTCTNVNENGVLSSISKSICSADDCDSNSKEMIDASNSAGMESDSCLDALPPTLIHMDSMICEASNEIDLSSCTMISEIEKYSKEQKVDSENDIIGCISEEIVDGGNSTCMEPNSCLDALSPSLINLDSMQCEASNEINLSSCTMISGIEKYSEEHKVESENDLLTTSDNRTSYGVETYSNDIFTSSIKEQELVKMDVSSNELESDIGSSRALFDKGSIGIMSSKRLTPVGTGHPRSIISSDDCALHSNMKVSVLEEMNILSNELESCFHSSKAEVDARDTTETDGRNPLHFNVAKTSWVHSSDNVPILDMFPKQSEDEFIGVAQKHGDISGYEELRMDAGQPMEFVLLADQSSPPASQPTDELGYVAELENMNRPSIELDWGLSPLKMVGGCELKSQCMWCGREFDHEGISSELQSDVVGFMCPTCKEDLPSESN